MSQRPSFIAKCLNSRVCRLLMRNTSSLKDGNNNCCKVDDNNGGTCNVSDGVTVSCGRSEILAWLSPLGPGLRHYSIRVSRVRNVGDWLLRTEQFQSWRSGDCQGESQKAAIFCSGNIGVGKTYISSLVIDTLCDEGSHVGEDIAVACFYFDFAAQKEQSATSILGALLRQVVGSFRRIPEEIMDAFGKQEKVIGGRGLQLPEIVKLLGSLSSTRRMFLCLDAIDECAAAERAKILLSLRDIIKISPATRVFMTGRPHVGAEVERHLPGGAAVVSVSPRRDEIIQYIQTKLLEDTTPDEMDKRLEAEIEKKIPETVSEIFRLVSVNLNAILQETNIRRRRERLSAGTDLLGLEDAYGTTLGRIKAQGGQRSRLGMAALMWVCYSERELRAEELCWALAVEIGSRDYCNNGVSSIRTVLSCCQGLVVVDRQQSIVRLIHSTLQEYLTSQPDLFRRPHSTIAETCLTYLNSKQVIALSAVRSPCTKHMRFLEYSTLYWGAHMKKEHSENGKMLALGLFRRYACHASIKLLLEHTLGPYSTGHVVEFYKFTGLHCASMFGLVEVVKALIEVGELNINDADDTGITPLMWAARNGHAAVAKFLLRREGINPDRPDSEGQTPISWAARNGHEELVKLLLGSVGVNPDGLDRMGRTPISWASGKGYEAVVQLLLRRKKVNPDRPDHGWGRTPISWAARNGHEVVVELLLGQKDVNPNWQDSVGRTPISWAAGNGYEAVVKLLLCRKEVESDRLDRTGRSPISWASGSGHEGLVKLLLGSMDVNPDKSDSLGRTPISWAAGNGYEAVVKLLLCCRVVNPDRSDRAGRPPISWAAERGHEAVVKLLLGRKDVNPHRVEMCGRKPILWASMNGHDAVVKLLRGLEDVKPDKPDYEGQTPISRDAGDLGETLVEPSLGCHGLTSVGQAEWAERFCPDWA